jgi:DNA-binding transcriptional regulator LsrR (DeoR family)
MTDQLNLGSRLAGEKRRRLSIDDDLKVQLAIERFSGNIVDVRDLAKRHGRAEAVVSRAITSAFREGLVEVKRVRRFEFHRNAPLERAFQSRFRNLRNALIVDVKGQGLDFLHEHLGHALARFVFDGLLRDNEKLLLGAGRCVFHMADFLCKVPTKLRTAGVTIVSVCGDSYPYHEVTRNICLDADANVSCMSQAFDPPTLVGLTSHHVFDAQENTQWRRRYYNEFWVTPPTIGILGVGMLDSEHQLALLTDPERRKGFPPTNITDELRARIQDLLFLTKNAVSGEMPSRQHVVAELGMHLFVVPGSERTQHRAELAQLQELVDAINAELFSPTIEQLAAVQSIVLVGGGVGKSRALRLLLDNGSTWHSLNAGRALPIHVVCMDSDTAKQVLST